MDFRHLEYFVEIARENNISRAAEKLYVSQSAVNQQLLKLEKELGTQLFVRSHRNWRLTQAGEIYLEGCRKALQIRQDTYRQIADITESRASTLTVGLTPNRGLTMFTGIYPRLHEKFPDLTVVPIELDAQSQQEAAARGEIDLGFMVQISSAASQHTCIDLGKEEMVLLVPADHPVCEIYQNDTLFPVIDLNLLKDTPFILTRKGSSGSVHRQVCDRIFADAGFSPNILMETTSTSHIVQMSETCHCCGIIPRYYAEPDNPAFRFFVLKNHPGWHLYITHRQDVYLTHAAREYIRLAKEYWKEHLVPPQSN